MAKVVCPHCGHVLQLQGLAGICPKCEHVVFARLTNDSPTSDGKLKAGSDEPSKSEPTPSPGDLLDELKQITQSDHFRGVVPDPDQRVLQDQLARNQQRQRQRRIWVGVALVGTVVGFLVVLGTAVSLLPKKVAQTPKVTVVLPPLQVPAPQMEIRSLTTSSEPPQITTAPAVTVAPAAPSATRPSTAPAHPHSALLAAQIRPIASANINKQLTDAQLGRAIERGAAFLKAQYSQSLLKDYSKIDRDIVEGMDALGIYALIHTGQSISDPDLQAQSPLIGGMLDRLKELSMTGRLSTYARSLRVTALAAANRPADRAAIDADVQYLLRSSMRGAYTYSRPMDGITRDSDQWDNSNSQYGALGIWAASEIGIRVPAGYWADVERHWLTAQTTVGGWGYYPHDPLPRLSMTAAGLTMLFVARDQQTLDAGATPNYQTISRPIQQALGWLDEADHSVNIPNNRGYTLYGLERAGLASGYKYFGAHDWFLELATELVEKQKPDGSWEGTPNDVVETAFDLLFLARGRHPVLIAKLKFDGPWNNRPRDLNVFSKFASYQLERPLNWEAADPQRQWYQWSDANVLLITSNRAPNLNEETQKKLRAFAENGGLIFLNTENDSAEFNQFVDELSRTLFPQYPLATVSENHPIYSTVFNMTDEKPALRGVSNGSRLLLVHSPTDLARSWQVRPGRTQRAGSDLALNIAIYGNGRRDLRNRLMSTYVPFSGEMPTALVPMARLQYAGNWDPEPAGWERTSRILQISTSLRLDPATVEISNLNYDRSFFAHLTGTEAFTCSDLEADALRQFVLKGGTLLIDACGGSTPFANSIESNLLPRLFPSSRPIVVDGRHPVLRATDIPGMKDLPDMVYRPGKVASEIKEPLLLLQAGKGRIIFSRIDMSTALTGASTADLAGFAPRFCQDLIQNLTIWAIQQAKNL